MILKREYLDDLKQAIREEPDDLFNKNGFSKGFILSSDDTLENLWMNYQKSIEDYDLDPATAFYDALDTVLGIKAPTPKTAPKFIVVIISDRDIQAVKPADSLEDAVNIANTALAELITDMGYEQYYEDSQGEGTDWGKATIGSPCAWCNLEDDWNAHICNISEFLPD